MRESVIYQDILEEGRAEGIERGLAEGRAEGRAEAQQELAVKMLQEGIIPEVIARVTELSIEQIQKLQAN
ncbi:hypothetical protein K9N68_27955 [Kovacikia minuta CCNUW1]|uniref:hypothetical protein n=1 Tax=Kovacikia minuta TaxID=2931930 RepID=UPI001CC908C9|nr:hypothetical protein [Kovacikia minuta]UBF25394.1 hypothetical protein K9N68_27955 [Kovacikia minuta CCNUW1]